MSRKIIAHLKKLLDQEQGAISREWGHRWPLVLVYPQVYEVGMSNLGFQAVYHLLNDHPDLACERAFLPPADLWPEYQRTGTPILSLESQRPLTDFAALAFAIPYEADYPQVLKILEQARIPLLALERGPNFPLVLAGGVTTFLNPEPLAPFIDAFFLGEAEVQVADFFQFLATGGRSARDRRQMLQELAANQPGVYVPAGYRPVYQDDGTLAAFLPAPGYPAQVKALHPADLDVHPCHSHIIAPASEFGQMFLVEVSRGCGRGCRFCAAGFIYRPPRFRSVPELSRQIKLGLIQRQKIGLVGAAVSDHPAIHEICRQVVEAGGQLGISSIRADSTDRELFELLARGGVKSIALAPEAGSERLRRVINKGLSEAQLINAVTNLRQAGIPRLRLYFMVGLPTETREEVRDIARLVKRLKHAVTKSSRGRKRLANITVSLHSFIPKPFTPLQWVPFLDLPELKDRIRLVKRELKGSPQVRVHADLPKWAYIQALLARGDRRVAQMLLAAHRAGGNWTAAFRLSPLNPDFFVLRPRGAEELFPWDFIDHGLEKSYLWEEYQQALAGQETPPCDPQVCRRCGVCRPSSNYQA
ncbi:MAG: radical SAM protein [Deltaproteobacteria bacterium]|nr:radical SAM protein [Deltaproteobacteria bacterium]MBW1952212.1 radical SAM protein [Deltaproteobacteria bacterium]MBW1985811.1 radical SAM protein [Deltaproteobacteria bacterium]MBW2133871.1 radical SAM protein [Deltaproteobacteria bacterium]